VTGEAPDSLLDSYNIERRAVAAIVGGSGDNIEATIALPGSEGIDAVATALANAEEHFKAAVAETEIGLNYQASPILGSREKDASCGAERDIGHWVGETGPHKLIDYDKHTLLLLLGDADSDTARRAVNLVRAIAGRHASRLKLCVVARNGAEAPDIFDDKTGAVHRRLSAGAGPCLCIVRPDGHLGLRSSPPSSEAVEAYFARIFN
jgi:hypothetical protein